MLKWEVFYKLKEELDAEILSRCIHVVIKYSGSFSSAVIVSCTKS